jgi:hypothetical protein
MTTRPRSHASLADLAGTLGIAAREAAQDAGLSPRRVQIPAYTDRWMMGDRYGEITRTYVQRPVGDQDPREIAVVLLDKSGKTMRFILNDCTEV